MASKKKHRKKREAVAKPKDGLTTRQRRFVVEYLVSGNATDAARKAGYSERTASEQGYENLRKPQIQSAIAKAEQERFQRLQMAGDEALAEIAHLSRSRMRHYASWTSDGEVTYTPSESLTDAQDAAIKSIKSKKKTIPQEDGEPITEITLELTLHDKLSALKMIGQHQGFFEDDKQKNDVNVNLTVHSHLDALGDEEAEELARHALERRSRGTIGADPAGGRGSPP